MSFSRICCQHGKMWDIVQGIIQVGCSCLPAMRATMTLEQRRVHWCRSEAAQVHSSAPWDGSLGSCQAQRSCQGVILLSRKPWWPEEFLLPRQLHNLSCCAACSDSGDHSEMFFSYCTWQAVMETGGSCPHGTPLWQDEAFHFYLSPLGPSAGKGDWNVPIAPMPGNVVLGFEGFLNIAAPVHFVSRHVFILHFCGFSGKVAQSTVLLGVLGSWWGEKGTGKSWQLEPRKQTARKNTWLLGLISLGSKVESKNM